MRQTTISALLSLAGLAVTLPGFASDRSATIPALARSPYVLQLQRSEDPATAVSPYRLDPRFRPAHAAQQQQPASRTLADKPFSREVEVFSREAKVDPALVHAIIHVESRHRQNAVSPKGALGLMQVMPATAQRYGVRTAAKSADENLKAGTRYLKDLMDMFDGKLDLVLAAYNAGEGAVMRYKAIPPYKETRAYVPAVLAKYEEWKLPDLKLETRLDSIVYLPGTRLSPETMSAFRRS